LVSEIESKLTLFEVQEKGCRAHSPEPCQSGLGEAPEAFNAVDMSLAPGKFIAAMINSQVLAVTDIDKAIVATPTVGIDDALWCYFAAYNGLQRGFKQSGTISVLLKMLNLFTCQILLMPCPDLSAMMSRCVHEQNKQNRFTIKSRFLRKREAVF
jgi:hypothetical protein